ncbi:putative mitochondrial import inner membrane translocase [Podospora aff. communis PSN243]|uniref:Mitochondrial import inner membrane translocase subunit n=1 Tax=Podospora aff. communis PSN243 TaxID=3040156 RepID=A0AAV9H7S0_9PEZI|nr:putative mitochondrial import inner membrane translocase [Podospora aff. communis PSN243]
MDSTPSFTDADLARLTDSDKQELKDFIDKENKRTKFQAQSHNLTDMCWKKCFATSTIKSGALDKSEETCLANCVGRFLDLNVATLKHVQSMRH